MSSNDLAATMRSILKGDHQLSAELSTVLVSLGSAVNQLKIQQDATVKELELVINLPLPFGQSKIQSLQLLFDKIGYSKLLSDLERDLIAADILYVNKNGSCNMAFFVSQRHHDYLMSANFQRKIAVAYN